MEWERVSSFLMYATRAVFSLSYVEHSEGMQIHEFDTDQRESP